MNEYSQWKKLKPPIDGYTYYNVVTGDYAVELPDDIFATGGCTAPYNSPSIFEQIAHDIGVLVTQKNKAYGDSFSQSHRIIDVLYPNGVKPEQYRDMLATIRIVDKLFRIATNKGYGGENPWRDVAGYAILAVSNESKS
jgi:hypothetical protein